MLVLPIFSFLCSMLSIIVRLCCLFSFGQYTCLSLELRLQISPLLSLFFWPVYLSVLKITASDFSFLVSFLLASILVCPSNYGFRFPPLLSSNIPYASLKINLYVSSNINLYVTSKRNLYVTSKINLYVTSKINLCHV